MGEEFPNAEIMLNAKKTHWGFPGGSVVKNSPANAGDMVQS